MKFIKIFDAPNLGGKKIIDYLGLKNIDLIIAIVVIGIWFWLWEEFLRDFFAWLIYAIFRNSYGIPRTRVLAEYFVLYPLFYVFGYFHYKIKNYLYKKCPTKFIQ